MVGCRPRLEQKEKGAQRGIWVAAVASFWAERVDGPFSSDAPPVRA